MQAPHNRDRQRQDQDIGDDIHDPGEAREGGEVDAVTSRNREIPQEFDGCALEGSAEGGNDAQNHAQNAKQQMAYTPCP